MSAPAVLVDDASAFGTYTPDFLTRRLISLSRTRSPFIVGRGAIRRICQKKVRSWQQKPVDTVRDGFSMRLYLGDNKIEDKLLFHPHLDESEDIELLLQQLKRGDVFIDIGANAGFYTLYGAREVGEAGCVVAVEPNPVLCRRMAFNVALNHLAQIRPVECAVGETRGTVRLYFQRERSGASLIQDLGWRFEGEGQKDSFEVAMRPLLDIVAEAGCSQISAMKVDVEGYEDRVLLPFFAAAPKDLWPRFVLMEYIFSEVWQTDCITKMQSLGYREVFRSDMNVALALG